MKNLKNFQEMPDVELNEKLAALKNELFNLRFQHSTGQLTNPKQLTNVKKDIARIKTIITERELKITKISVKGAKK